MAYQFNTSDPSHGLDVSCLKHFARTIEQRSDMTVLRLYVKISTCQNVINYRRCIRDTYCMSLVQPMPMDRALLL